MTTHVPDEVYRLIEGRAIATLREMRGDTQTAFAVEVGVSQATLSRIERGQCAPSHRMFRRLARSGGPLHQIDRVIDRALERAEQIAAWSFEWPEGAGVDWSYVRNVVGDEGLRGLATFAAAVALRDTAEDAPDDVSR